MQYITVQLEKRFTLQKKIQTASLYPTLVLTAAVAMAAFLAYGILPQLIDFFTAFDVELPPTTQLLLFLANAFKFHGWLIGLTGVGAVVLAAYLMRAPFSKPVWDRFVLRIPVLGSFVAAAQLTQFSRNLGMLITTGVPAAGALTITASTLSNTAFSSAALKLEAALIKGKSIADTIEHESLTVFPPLTAKLVGVGEKTGKLDEALLYLADFYEAEVESTSRNMTTLLEPLLLLAIGLLVGFVALAIITPIYELSGSIRK
jgi:type IV pilus assembly protein PilC